MYSFVLAGLLFLVFCFLRPRNSRVYAPRAKHADEKHRPIPLGKKPFSWLSAVKDVKEQDLVDKIGLDAVVFLRFMRMLRNIFCVVTAIGCGILIPINVVGGSPFYKQWKSVPTLMKVSLSPPSEHETWTDHGSLDCSSPHSTSSAPSFGLS